jgi:hypothetical protein
LSAAQALPSAAILAPPISPAFISCSCCIAALLN